MKTLLDTVEPDGWEYGYHGTPYYFYPKVESLLAECWKQTLLGAADHFAEQISYSDATTEEERIIFETLARVVVELRRMAEGETK